jgi:hypothetical protein
MSHTPDASSRHRMLRHIVVSAKIPSVEDDQLCSPHVDQLIVNEHVLRGHSGGIAGHPVRYIECASSVLVPPTTGTASSLVGAPRVRGRPALFTSAALHFLSHGDAAPILEHFNVFSFCNPILFAICTSTFSKLCKNVYSGM